eukprot:jgi/Mesen1/258/ME1144341C07588
MRGLSVPFPLAATSAPPGEGAAAPDVAFEDDGPCTPTPAFSTPAAAAATPAGPSGGDYEEEERLLRSAPAAGPPPGGFAAPTAPLSSAFGQAHAGWQEQATSSGGVPHHQQQQQQQPPQRRKMPAWMTGGGAPQGAPSAPLQPAAPKRASLVGIARQFQQTDEVFLLKLLLKLEEDFTIYRKNGMYKVM